MRASRAVFTLSQGVCRYSGPARTGLAPDWLRPAWVPSVMIGGSDGLEVIVPGKAAIQGNAILHGGIGKTEKNYLRER